MREKFCSKEMFLNYLYNHLGCRDLELCCSYIGNEGNMCFSKWIRYETLLGLGNNDDIPELKGWMTKKEFLEKSNHRSILDIEVMIDIDDPLFQKSLYIGSDGKIPSYQNIGLKSVDAYRILRGGGVLPVVYTTQNKSIHLSFLYPPLRLMNRYQRRLFKEDFIKLCGGDLHKASDRCMIAMEGEPHYRSKKLKVRLNVV